MVKQVLYWIWTVVKEALFDKDVSIFSSGGNFAHQRWTACAILRGTFLWIYNKFGPVVKEILFKDISIFSSDGHFVLTEQNTNDIVYSKTCLKWPLKNRQNKGLKDEW